MEDLFADGRLGRLRGYGRDGFPDGSWVRDASELRTVPGRAVDLVTLDTYRDFELDFEWRVAPGGNSGVIYRVVESAEPAWTTGPEYQILDDDLHRDGANPLTSAGALYDLLAPAPGKRLSPVGDWNAGRVVVRDGIVEHWLNGAVVVRYEWAGEEVRRLIAASKFRDLAGFMSASEGRLVLQHHGEEAAFREVRVRRLG